jgi:hypothetical protein
MSQKNDESQIVLALRAMQNDPKLSARAAGKIYSVDHQKFSRRRHGMQPRRDIPASSRKLTDLEESVLIQHILDLSAKGSPPRVSVVEDMANRRLATRDQPRVGKHWVSNFIKRRPELCQGLRSGDQFCDLHHFMNMYNYFLKARVSLRTLSSLVINLFTQVAIVHELALVSSQAPDTFPAEV